MRGRLCGRWVKAGRPARSPHSACEWLPSPLSTPAAAAQELQALEEELSKKVRGGGRAQCVLHRTRPRGWLTPTHAHCGWPQERLIQHSSQKVQEWQQTCEQLKALHTRNLYLFSK